MSIERAIYKLVSIAGVPSDRIYAMRAPQNCDAPFVIYQRTSGDRIRDINSPSGIVQATFQIDVYDREYHATRLLALDIEENLDGFSGTVAFGSSSPQETIRIGGISCQNDVDLFDETDEPFLYRVSSDYLVTYHQN